MIANHLMEFFLRNPFTHQTRNGKIIVNKALPYVSRHNYYEPQMNTK